MSLNKKLRKAHQAHARGKRSSTLARAGATCGDADSSKALSVVGPYRNRDKWPLVLMDGTGRQSKVYDTREEAEAIKARLLAEVRAKYGKTIGESLDEY